MVVKIQKSLSSSDGPSILIYNENRSVMEILPLTEEIDRWFGNRYKKYAEAYTRGTELVIQGEVPDQDW